MKLVVVCGFPGVGKTTVAETIARRVDAKLLRTDVIRKELLSDPEYTDEETQMVYGEMLRRSQATIEGGRNVVLDGTFFKRDFRERVRELADDLNAEFDIVRVHCDEEVVRERIRNRENGASDADFEVYQIHRDIFEPLDIDHVTVDNSEGIEQTRQQVRSHF